MGAGECVLPFLPNACWLEMVGCAGVAKRPVRSSIPLLGFVISFVVVPSSKSIREVPCIFVESSDGTGFAAAAKSPFLKASYRPRTVLIWSLIWRNVSSDTESSDSASLIHFCILGRAAFRMEATCC